MGLHERAILCEGDSIGCKGLHRRLIMDIRCYYAPIQPII
jgi:hypothetical protein